MAGAGRLICVTAAACIDRYLRFPHFQLGRINRPSSVITQAGGKGINVARTARSLGVPVSIVGHASDPIRAGVDSLGVPARWSNSTRTRQCLCILDETTGELTEIYEPIPAEPPTAWPELYRIYCEEIGKATDNEIVTLSGRLPASMPKTALTTLVSKARAAGLTIMIDSDDPGAGPALEAQPNIVKINAEETENLTGCRISDPRSACEAARALHERGAQTVVITLGEQGCLYFDGHQRPKHLPAPSVAAAAAVGSGDAFLAGLACGLLAGDRLDDSVRLAAAAATATAQRFVTGDITPCEVQQLLGQIPPAIPVGP